MTDREMIEQMENDICNACKPRVAKCKCNFVFCRKKSLQKERGYVI